MGKVRDTGNTAAVPPGTAALTCAGFIARLLQLCSAEEQRKIERYFKTADENGVADIFLGVPMGQVFGLAKEHIAMPLPEIELLMESPIHEARAGAMSIMDKQARGNKLPEVQRKALHDLYLRRHDRINNWDLVDLAAIHVIGRYLFDKPREELYTLTRSTNMWERRTAIVSTAYFLKQKQHTDTFAIAELLVYDPEDLVQKAVGGWIRQAGKTDPAQLLTFLDKYAGTMPRTMLRYAVEHLDAPTRQHYMDMKKIYSAATVQ